MKIEQQLPIGREQIRAALETIQHCPSCPHPRELKFQTPVTSGLTSRKLGPGARQECSHGQCGLLEVKK